MLRPMLSLAAFAGTLFLAAPAQAASFDCARARGADEVTICRTPSLSALDSEMGGLWYAYSRVPMAMGGNGNRGDEARDFLARRRACAGNIGCLTARPVHRDLLCCGRRCSGGLCARRPVPLAPERASPRTIVGMSAMG